MALARCLRRRARCWFGNDSPPDIVKITRLRHARFRSGHRVYLCHGRPRNCTEPYRSGQRFP